MAILDRAVEDCYWVIEFIENLRKVYATLTEQERRAAIVLAYRGLVQDGSVRVHRGGQCYGNVRAGEEYTVSSETLDEAFQDVWSFRFGVDEPNLCVCNTETTRDAHNALYRELHGDER